MTTNEILKSVRAELNITQEQLARELNVVVATINRWENGHNTPSRLARMRFVTFV
jgi:DNA-binding transcriptional regulator YiaG